MIFLIYLVYLQRRDFKWMKRLHHGLFLLPLVGELAFLTAITYQYGGMLPLALLSTLITLYNYRSNFLLVMAGCALLNILAIPSFGVLTLFVTNLGYITIAVLLYRLRVTTDEKHDIDALHETLRVKQYQHEETRQNVIEYAQKVQGLTQLEERNRIAHDLHDDLGHRLIRLKMMLEAATRLGADQQDQAMDLVKEVATSYRRAWIRFVQRSDVLSLLVQRQINTRLRDC